MAALPSKPFGATRARGAIERKAKMSAGLGIAIAGVWLLPCAALVAPGVNGGGVMFCIGVAGLCTCVLASSFT
jgi:hypothetical protein